MRRAVCTFTMLSLLLASQSVLAQFEGFGDFGGFGAEEPSDPVTISASIAPATADRPALLQVVCDIEPGYHVYSITQPKGGPLRTTITPAPSDKFRVIGPWQSSPQPRSYVDNETWGGLTVEDHADRVVWFIPIALADGVDPGKLAIGGEISLQACKEACIPVDAEFTAKLGEPLVKGEVVTDPSLATPPPVPPTSVVPPGKQPTPPAEAGMYRADDSEITWYGWLEPAAVAAGGETTLFLQAQPAGNWHVNAYSPRDTTQGVKPTLIGFEPQSMLATQGPIAIGKVIERDASDIGFGTIRYHEGTATWQVPVRVASTATGTAELAGVLGYQACEGDDGACELIKGIRFRVPVTVGTGDTQVATVEFAAGDYADAATLAASSPAAVEPASQPAATTPDLPLADSLNQRLEIVEFNTADGDAEVASVSTSFLGQILAALIGGFILNFMPCVLPVIGLKVLSFAKQGGENRARIIALNFAYIAGVMSIFLLLATLAVLPQLGIGGEEFGWGELNTYTSFKVTMTAVVFAMALSFLGIWEIPLPGFAGTGAAADLASREGYSGAFAKGVLTTILATPCSGPFIGPVLTYTISQPPHITYAIFTAIGLGMSLPYIFIAFFPSLVKWIPKPGAWMDTFKQFMAFLLLGTVVYLFSTINDSLHVATLTLLIGIWFACWLVGKTPYTASTAKLATTWGAAGLAGALIGYGAFTFLVPGDHELQWREFDPDLVLAEQRQGRTAMVDFTADWCPTCQLNMHLVIDTKTVGKITNANDVAVFKADWSDRNPTIKAALAQLRSKSIPLLAIYPANQPGKVIVLRDTISQKQLLRALALAGAERNNDQADWARTHREQRVAQLSRAAN